MKLVWCIKSGGRYKCRAVVCGNFATRDPTEQVWTAQAETASVMCSLRLATLRGWEISKIDVKGASYSYGSDSFRLKLKDPDTGVKAEKHFPTKQIGILEAMKRMKTFAEEPRAGRQSKDAPKSDNEVKDEVESDHD